MIYTYFKKNLIILSLLSSILLFSNNSLAADSRTECANVPDYEIQEIIKNLKKQSYYIGQLTDCQTKSYRLFARLIELNSNYFEYADESLKEDVTFAKNFVKKYPNILYYISPQLKNDPVFFKSIVNLYGRALEYASNELLDDRNFMKEMVDIRTKNFMYASERLQDDFEFVSYAVKKDGLVLRYASSRMRENRIIVMQALKSNILASTYISSQLQESKEIKNLVKKHDYSFLVNIESFLRNNYGGIEVGPSGSRGYHIVNQALFLKQKPIIDRSDFFKWRFWEGEIENDVKLSTGRIRQLSWKTDLKDYPDLVKEIRKFLDQRLNKNTADSLTLTSLWVIPSNPDVVIFKMYLLRHVNNTYSNTSINNTSYVVGVAYNKAIRPEVIKEEEIKKENAVAPKAGETTPIDPAKVTSTPTNANSTATTPTPQKSDATITTPTPPTAATIPSTPQQPSNVKSLETPVAPQQPANIRPAETPVLAPEVKTPAPAAQTPETANKSAEQTTKKPETKEATKNDWVLTIIDSDMDVDLDNDIILRNNHQEYDFWDVFENNGDKTSNLIFRVKDKNSESFEIFSKQEDDKYKSIFTGGGYNFDY